MSICKYELWPTVIILITSMFKVCRTSDKIKRLEGRVYTGLDPFGTGKKFVQISLVFIRDMVDPVRIGSVIWYQTGSLNMKLIQYGTVPAPCKQSGSVP